MTNSATVWSDKRNAFVGMLSISDFLEILYHVLRKQRQSSSSQRLSQLQNSGFSLSTNQFGEPGEVALSSLEDIPSLRIAQWQSIMCSNNKSVPKLLSISPESTLLEVCMIDELR